MLDGFVEWSMRNYGLKMCIAFVLSRLFGTGKPQKSNVIKKLNSRYKTSGPVEGYVY